MDWVFYIVLGLALFTAVWAIAEYFRAPRRPEAEETQQKCCYNCSSWLEDAEFETYELSGMCTKNSTDKVACYTTWNFVCGDHAGELPEEEKYE